MKCITAKRVSYTLLATFSKKKLKNPLWGGYLLAAKCTNIIEMARSVLRTCQVKKGPVGQINE